MKSVDEIKAYSLSFLRCVSDNLNYNSYSLRISLIDLIQQENSDIYIAVNPKDWDLNSIRQRAKPWAKRILLMQKVNQVFE